MTELYNWTAGRSGAAITVNGRTAADAPLRLAQVKQLHPSRQDRGVVIAVTAAGEHHRLHTTALMIELREAAGGWMAHLPGLPAALRSDSDLPRLIRWLQAAYPSANMTVPAKA